MTTLTKSVRVLTMAIGRPDGVWFSVPEEDGRLAEQTHTMQWDDWCDMGKPDHITVTIEPGDRLNDGGAS